jgi:hypothetical protein
MRPLQGGVFQSDESSNASPRSHQLMNKHK